MMNTADNPPAFPSEQHETQDGSWNQTYGAGMSLRDYYAGQALIGDFACQNETTGEWPNTVPDSDIAKRVVLYFRFADAMLAQRTKTQGAS